MSEGDKPTVRIDIQTLSVDKEGMKIVADAFSGLLAGHGHSIVRANETPEIDKYVSGVEAYGIVAGAARILRKLGQEQLVNQLVNAHFPDNHGEIPNPVPWAQFDNATKPLA